ncbi:Tail protein I [Qipengyuania citrea LAMA 915]|uniref:Tail protein I n=1 Tax=Qipengyuania citrea LAMA 915 TaxID=1306953 RepID=A0A0L1KEX6_9SPHN|nr:phage tail protein I [Qipengyuania citrea]KNH02615.1 Tail protein I [Qipengyuania citrea LAMA 915]
MTLLPPNSTRLESAIESATSAGLTDVPVPIRDVWNPATCPAGLLPFLAWGVSIDLWNSEWSEAEKREAVASAIEDQRRKGTRASLRDVLDRFDPLIQIVEWFEDRGTLEPHTFRLELPLGIESDVEYDTALVAALLRDIAAVKPLRSHMRAVHRLHAQAQAGLLGGGMSIGLARISGPADLTIQDDPYWATVLQTEEGEPFEREQDRAFLEHI